MTTVNEIRSEFLNFFGSHDHEIVPSAPLVPFNDPTLLFVNAGMVPFKNLFTGVEKRHYTRAASSQKCVRAGGKHNDLDNVGYTARHHTFFEMLGNFSFGDYFKEEAIKNAWDLITKGYGLDQNRLLVTVYAEDDEAHALWRKIGGLSDDRIIRISTSDNFWSMGDTGPCGPCSEIFFDHGEHIAGGPPGSPDEDGDRFIEIWNLVFMQYEQLANGVRQDLPEPSIDTGMGLERISAVLQGVHNNYEIDTFQKIIDASQHLIGREADTSTLASHRVIADHLRACSFLIADGVLPSNEGRGYVLRRIMRRAMRHAHLLGAQEPLMHRLAPSLITEMGQAFPELPRAQELIAQTFELEERRFRSMLTKGMHLLDQEVAKLADGADLPGEVAFKLYDTYGFPLDLTQDAMRSDNRAVDISGFDSAMAEQKAKARAAWSGSGAQADDSLWFDLKDKHGATEFIGYGADKGEGQVLAIVRDGAVVDNLRAGEEGIVLLSQTPFYGESGGQMGDSGTFKTLELAARVTDTGKAIGALHTHHVCVDSGSLRTGDAIEAAIDTARRAGLRANHSATHLLHAVLREELGDHVTQKGSLVSPDRLRFDISHPQAMTPAEMRRVETRVNDMIRDNGAVETRLLSYDEAIDAGALALFGEKYGDEVRVLFMGPKSRAAQAGSIHYSIELCGGTHVRAMGDIGAFVIVSEGAVSAGVRRLEALTGAEAIAHLQAQEDTLFDAAAKLKIAPADLGARVDALLADKKRLEKELAEVRKKAALGGGTDGPAAKDLGGVKFLGQILEGVSVKDLRDIASDALKQLGSGVVAFVAVNDGKAGLIVTRSDDLADKINAVDLVRTGAAALGGKGGGGRPDFAQAGGPDGGNASLAISGIEGAILGD